MHSSKTVAIHIQGRSEITLQIVRGDKVHLNEWKTYITFNSLVIVNILKALVVVGFRRYKVIFVLVLLLIEFTVF